MYLAGRLSDSTREIGIALGKKALFTSPFPRYELYRGVTDGRGDLGGRLSGAAATSI